MSKRVSLNNVLQQPSFETLDQLQNLEVSRFPKRPKVKQQTAYLPLPVYEQLRIVAFEERKKMHDYIIEGIDLIFKARGLPSIKEISKQ